MPLLYSVGGNMVEYYVVIRDMSAGNESVGEMWQETKIFHKDVTLEKVMEWAMDSEFKEETQSRKRITITRPANFGKAV